MIGPRSYRDRAPRTFEAMRLDADNAKDMCDWLRSLADRYLIAESPSYDVCGVVRFGEVIVVDPGQWLMCDDHDDPLLDVLNDDQFRARFVEC